MSAAGVVVILSLLPLATASAAVLSRRAARQRWRRLRDGAASPNASGRTVDMSGPVARAAQARGRHLVAAWSPSPGRRRLVLAFAGAGCAIAASLAAGPAAGVVLGIYGSLGARMILNGARGRAEARARTHAIEVVAGLAAELRAGLAASDVSTTAVQLPGEPDIVRGDAAIVVRRVMAAVQVAESSGAPLADVLDRLDAHLRAAQRARSTASAQAAGARASALLLAGMPVAGGALGAVIGINPAQTLFHTPLGGACLVGAVLLQVGGLAWSGRLSRVEVAL